MACKLMKLNYNTGHAVFSIDDNSDLNNLPDLNNTGKSEMSVIKNISQGSLAIGSNGENYILTGNNKWIKYNGNINRQFIFY